MSSRRRLRVQLAHVTRFVGLLFIMAGVLWLTSELLNQGSGRALWIWLDDSPRLAFLNLGIFFSVACLVAFATNRLDASAQVGLLLMALPLASAAKQRWLLQPLLPADLRFAPQAVQVLGSYASPGLCLLMGLGVAGTLLLLGAAMRRVRVVRLTVGARIVGGAVSLLLPTLLCATPLPILDEVLRHPDDTNLTQLYCDNGFMLSFMLETHAPMGRPDGYSEPALLAIVQSLPSCSASACSPTLRPDVVVILSESFWDPTDLPAVQFPTDPAPNYHALRHETRDLRFLSPTFGGHTANVEFELLTGLSMFFEAEGSVPFNSRMNDLPMPSIVRHFKSLGYSAKAVHTYHRDFYFRDQNYARLGFDTFEGDEAFAGGEYKGLFLADAQLGDRIVGELQHAGEPLFLMAITMENHGPYRADPGAPSSRVISKLPAPEHKALERLTGGIHDADAMLGRVASYLRKSQRPTVLLFFGDHLPALGPNLAVYRSTGFITHDQSPRDQLRLHSTPAVLWANYPLPLPNRDEALSPSLVWAELLPALGMGHPFYSDFLGRVRLQSPGLSHAVSLDAGGLPRAHPSPEAQAILQDYRLLQYDVFGGDRHSLVTLFGLNSFITPPTH